MDEAPAYDCELEVTAAASDDGTRYAFDLTPLGGAEALGAAVLPSIPTDRVVLESPAANAASSDDGPLPLIGVLLLAGLAATLWLRAGRGEPAPLVEPA